MQPLDFASLGSWSVTSGNYLIDTDALTIAETSAPGVILFTGVIDDQGGVADSFGPGGDVTTVGPAGVPHIAVFTFDDLSLTGTANITVTGHRALALLSHGDILIDVSLDVSGKYPEGGPGGFDGGIADSTMALDGLGPGGGGANPLAFFGNEHAGPAGYGSDGIIGAGSGGTAGLSYGDLRGALQGGSGGGGSRQSTNNSNFASGGGGGGALEIAGLGLVDLGANAVLQADGNPGIDGSLGVGSGPGSGGGIRISGGEIVLQGSVSANGVINRVYSGGGRVFLEGLGFYIVGTGFDPASLVANVSVDHGGGGGNMGVIFMEPKQTLVPLGETLELGTETVSTASTTAPELILNLGDVLVQGEVSVPPGGVTQEKELRLLGTLARITGADPLTMTGTLAGTGTAEVPVTIAAEGSLSLVDDTMTFPGDGNGATDDGLVNLGTMNLINATIDGDVRSPGGTTVNVAGTATFNGLFKGAAGFSGTNNEVVFNGGYEPGDSPAVVSFGGDLTLGDSNVLTMELGGPEAGAGYDQLDVSGALTLAGTLEVTLLSPFLPAGGQSFQLFESGSIGGSFDTVLLPALGGGLTWDASQLEVDGSISVVGMTDFATLYPALLPEGDENGDGLSNFYNYATGVDPTAPNNPLGSPELDGSLKLTLSQRNDGTDVAAVWEGTSELTPPTWVPLEQGVDYLLESQVRSGSQDVFTLQLLLNPESDSKMFFRQRFGQ